jgi:hypothetical protein
MAQSLEAKIVVLGSQGVGKTSLVCFISFEKMVLPLRNSAEENSWGCDRVANRVYCRFNDMSRTNLLPRARLVPSERVSKPRELWTMRVIRSFDYKSGIQRGRNASGKNVSFLAPCHSKRTSNLLF